MPVPTSISQLSQTASSNSPPGSENVGTQMNQYIQAAYAFIAQLNATMNPTGTLTAPSGTRLVMQQASAPAGWTIDTAATFTDAAMRFNQTVGNSGAGANTFSTINAGTIGYTSQFTAITVAQMPQHNHGINDPGHAHAVADPGHNHGLNDPGHSHFVNNVVTNQGGTDLNGTGSSSPNTRIGQSTTGSGTGISLNAATTAISIYGATTAITTQNNGSNAGHTHGFTVPLNIKYADCVVAIKS